jgi:UDP-N-acetylmuramoyl-tripeptide--D-alanyl-D-alanine ligase
MASSSTAIWTARDAASATGGKASGDWIATGLSIDTRTLKPGDLFIALKGDAGDGHVYVKNALAAGACAAVVSRAPDGVAADAPLLVVGDTLRALEDMGRAARARCGAKIVGVTGSVGKTGTKEMLAAAFGVLGQTHASQKSYNNHWGVPLTLASMHAGTDYGVFEMGMNHPGELTALTGMVRPHIAIITTIAAVHIEHFTGLEQIAEAKAEIFAGIEPGGTAVLNRDNEWFEFLSAKAAARGIAVRSFGATGGTDAHLDDCLEAANGSRVKATIMGETLTFTLQIPGRHIAVNALAVLLAVKLVGGDIKVAARALEKIEPIVGRGKREYLDIGDAKNPVTLIDESYNASPVAMQAAFRVLALIDPGRGGRRIAVLGDMREMGGIGPKAHAELALPLQAADVQLVYTCGPLMKNLYDALPQDRRGAHMRDSTELAQIVPEVLVPGDVVMVKGSNGSKMGVVVEALRKLPETFRRKSRSNETV